MTALPLATSLLWKQSVTSAELRTMDTVDMDMLLQQSAELQRELAEKNRELQIEAALEQVRARAMAMHHSNELTHVVATLFDRLLELGLTIDGALIFLFDKARRDIQLWVATVQLPAPIKVDLPFDETMSNNEIIVDLWKAVEKGEPIYNKTYTGETKNAYFRYVQKYNDAKIPEAVKQLNLETESYTEYFVAEANSILGFDSWSGPITSITADDFRVLKRFARVFDQAYVRFLDLQKAEAQTREARVEAALERVRARTMAMQHSEELRDVSMLLFDEVRNLGIEAWTTGFNVWSDDNDSYTDFLTNPQGGFIEPYTVDTRHYPILHAIAEARKHGDEFYVHCDEGEQLQETYRQLSTFGEQQFKAILDSGFQFPSRQYTHMVFGSKASLMFITYAPIPEADQDIFKRFGKVFEQTYTRFLDLQKAEAQAREAKIEAALERVRSQTMAMRNSEDVSLAAATMFIELQKLGIKNYRGGVLHIRKDQTMDVWSVNSLEKGNVIRAAGQWDMRLHPWWQVLYKGWMNQDEFLYYFLAGQEKEDYIQILNARTDYLPRKIRTLPDCHIHAYYFNEGAIWNFSLELHSDDQQQILKRFASVFSLTFRRYQDLRVAEAQAQEAIKASSLDRVRAEIASMRTTADLQRITPLIWNELTTLGVPFIRCGVFIMDENEKQVQVFLSSPDGRAIASFFLPYHATGPLHGVITQWQKKELFQTRWTEAAILEWTSGLLAQGVIRSQEQYLTEHRPTNLHLHFVPFLQGMLYVGSNVSLNEKDLLLVQSLADAFATAYARYEDFTKLEVAKQRIETTLTKLKSTQALLVQQEKMASLGELTAGKAHEIQNPLNFVNNFSDVNTELLAELKQEAQRGNTIEVMALAEDIEQNQQKITEHGRRADSIVKGMLQHSRGATGEKEPTDLNALVEQYLQLAYHGYRAKDKSFNTDVRTHYDQSIGNITLVPQDIGRVLLNLFNNAFYTVSEKKAKLNGTYQPEVMIGTEQEGATVRITVRDNGKGMPQQVTAKVFQPFFTTKPAGEGTGLGLSLSYDIITKGHGGELLVETTEGEGSTFIIRLLSH